MRVLILSVGTDYQMVGIKLDTCKTALTSNEIDNIIKDYRKWNGCGDDVPINVFGHCPLIDLKS